MCITTDKTNQLIQTNTSDTIYYLQAYTSFTSYTFSEPCVVYVGLRVYEHRLLNIIKLVIGMGTFDDWFKGKLQKPENNIKEPEWIVVGFSLSFDSKYTKSELKQIGDDLHLIFLNTHLLFNSRNEFLGGFNPYLGYNLLHTSNMTKDVHDTILLALYFPKIIKLESKRWKIEMIPHRKKGITKFSLIQLNTELFGLYTVSKWISEKYNVAIAETTSFNPIFIDKKPAIEEINKPNLFTIKYLVEDRIKYGEINNPQLDHLCLGESIIEYVNVVKKNKLLNPNRLPKKEEITRWLSEADKLVKKYNL